MATRERARGLPLELVTFEGSKWFRASAVFPPTDAEGRPVNCLDRAVLVGFEVLRLETPAPQFLWDWQDEDGFPARNLPAEFCRRENLRYEETLYERIQPPYDNPHRRVAILR